LTAAGTGFPTNLVEDVRSLQGWQKTSNGWEPIDLVGMVWVTATGAKYLQGNIDALVPSATNPVRVIVASTASAQAVGVATSTQAGLLVAGAVPGRLDGVAPAANMVGEQLSATAGAVATNTSTFTDVVTKTLTPGCWLVSGFANCDNVASQGGGSVNFSANGSVIHTGVWRHATGQGDTYTLPSQVVNVGPASSGIIKISVLSNTAAGSVSSSQVYAVRIA
jgi:hypothetical protein